MDVLSLILITCIIVSLLSFIGIFTFGIKDETLDKLILLLVSLSAGTLIGGGLLHLLPEAISKYSSSDPFTHIVLEMIGSNLNIEFFPIILESIQEFTGVELIPHEINNSIFLYVIIGFFMFFLIEKLLYWRHCHKGHCEIHTFAYMNLLGDSIHNFIDGLIMAATFISSIPLGIVTTIAIASHELPQEIGDFGVLLHGGFGKRRALAVNFIVALTAVTGGLFGYFIVSIVRPLFAFLLPFAAGGFLYIAATDLLPELKKEESMKRSALILLIFMLGIIFMWSMLFLFHE